MTQETPTIFPVVDFKLSDAGLAVLAEEYDGLTANTTDDYKAVVAAIRDCRERRVDIKCLHKSLKAESVAYGRKVDGECNRLTDALFAIENPLKLAKKEVDDEKARVKREAEEAVERRAEEVRRKAREKEDAERKAEQAKVKAEQQAEQNRLSAEKEQNRKEREAIDAEKEKLRLEREAIDREREEEAAKIKARKDAEEEVGKAKLRKSKEMEDREDNRTWLKAAKPDILKARKLVDFLRGIKDPIMTTADGTMAAIKAVEAVRIAANDLEKWCDDCEGSVEG